MHGYANHSKLIKEEDTFVFAEHVQGTVPHPIIRRDNGVLPHEHMATKELGSIENCNMEGNRIKHIIQSSASSLNWEDDDYDIWEIFNDRGNSNPEIDTESLQYVIIKDNAGTSNETFSKVDQNIPDVNEAITKGGELIAQDPRVVLYNGKRIIIYHSRAQRQMWLYDHKTKQTVMLTICGHRTDGIQKNWSPLVISDKILLLVYTIDPLVILRYDVDRGDGVCNLVYGHLPLGNGMDEPYGGTPFVEILSPITGNGVLAKSFLSMGHSRQGNDLISKGRKNRRRVYRPVPIVLHMFCIRRDETNMANIDSLEGCTFGTDVYDLWHEVESPDFVLKTKWKKTARNARSVSFPYDLHIFQENSIMRMGLEYEDCYSVYEDYKIDFDSILEKQLNHPVRVALEDNQKVNRLGLMPTLVESSRSDCPSVYSYAREQKLYVTSLANEDDLVQRIAGKIWIVSHQYRQRTSRRKKALDQIMSVEKIGRHERRFEGSQLDSILDHYPYPIQTKREFSMTNTPSLCIYFYGSM